MERNVVTLETAKKLKAAGFPESTPFSWHENTNGARSLNYLGTLCERCYATPTAQEIADRLPEQTDLALAVWRDQEVWIAQYEGDEDAPPKWLSEGLTMAEALANLYLKLNQPKEGK